ncbi:hypothetical protein ACMS09_004047 [Cronobacter malonaticus]
MKEREFSFTYRAEKGFLYEGIIFSLGEPLIMVGRVNNGLFTPARGRFCVILDDRGFCGRGGGRSAASAVRRAGIITQAAPGVTYPG